MSLPESNIHCRFEAEAELTGVQGTAIQDLLVAAFPQYADIFSQASYWGAQPDYRLWLELLDQSIVAHLDFEPRAIRVGSQEIVVAGVGEVATHPDRQGQGLGRRLMAELQGILRKQIPVQFGFLQCREAVVGFYTSVGWHPVYQQVQFIDPNTGSQTHNLGPTMVLPALASMTQWPSSGLVDLRDMPW